MICKKDQFFTSREDPIQLHPLIFGCKKLAVSKHIELKTNASLIAILNKWKKVADARWVNKVTKTEITMRAEPSL
jgi:hypothetical protein